MWNLAFRTEKALGVAMYVALSPSDLTLLGDQGSEGTTHWR